MAIATATPMPRKPPRPATGRCSLRLSINRTLYRVTPIRPDGDAAARAYRLTKPDGTAYDLARHAHGAECDCPDFVFRRDGLDPGGCKHIKAARAVGLLD